MAEVLKGYHDIPEADQKKAQVFFDRGKTVADSGQYDYAIEMYLQGLTIDPDSRDAHQQLRDISLKRKASGGKDLGMMEKMKLKRAAKEDKQNMLNAEKLMAYDPGNTDNMVTILQSAHRAGFYDTVMWMGPILLRANDDSKSPDVRKYLILKDVYKDLHQWKPATEACAYAMRADTQNMDLQSEMKNLGAQDTMEEGNYLSGGSFRASMKDRDSQDRMRDEDRDVRSIDMLTRQIAESEGAYRVDPTEGKLFRLVEQLEKTEETEHENRAIELLEEAFATTKQFRFRQRVGKIKMSQMHRLARSTRLATEKNPNDPSLKQQYEELLQEQLNFELKEYMLSAENYPTDLTHKYQVAQRLFELKRYHDAIPAFQQARSDPKVMVDASIALGRSFLEADFVDEAIETLQVVVDEYQLKGDERSKLMYYWQGRAFEAKGSADLALKRYSQVAQWEFTYKDVQNRIKRLRSGGGTAGK